MAENTSEHSPDKPPVIEWEEAPVETHEDFKNYVEYKPQATNLLDVPTKNVCFPPSNNPDYPDMDRSSYTSFGSDGTTSSVTAYGKILQISRFFGYGNSGFFCADQENTPEPFYVLERMQRLWDLSTDPYGGSGLHIGENLQALLDLGGVKPSLGFVFDRWPRFTFETPSQQKPCPDEQKDTKTSAPPSQAHTGGSPRIPALSIQFFCESGTVFQKYRFSFNQTKHSNFVTSDNLHVLDKLQIDTDFKISNLDFVKGNMSFNDMDDTNSGRYGPNNRSIILVNVITGENAIEMGFKEPGREGYAVPEAAALIITPFAYGKAQKVTWNKGKWFIELDSNAKQVFTRSYAFEITIGYRLQLVGKDQGWKKFIIPSQHLEQMETSLLSTQFHKIRFSQNNHLDFVIRRNLEHMLSVCSIPIFEAPTLGQPTPDVHSSARAQTSIAAIALTCGDISGHRIGSRASVYAFRFLLSVLEDIQKHEILDISRSHLRGCSCRKKEDICDACKDIKKYYESILERIEATLIGHIRWVCRKAQALTDGDFSPHYWATGRPITTWTWLPLPCLSDTPLQLLKILWWVQFREPSDGELMKKNICKVEDLGAMYLDSKDISILRKKIRPWIAKLDKTNKTGRYAFKQRFEENLDDHYIRHRVDSDTEKKFRLADHVLICLALACVEKLGFTEEIVIGVGDEAKTNDPSLRAETDPRITTTTDSHDGTGGHRTNHLQQEKEEGGSNHRLQENDENPQHYHQQDDTRDFQQDHVQKTNTDTQQNSLQNTGPHEIWNDYCSIVVKNNVLKRFTTEGPISKERMLATCRTPNDSRFLLHSKDTILFHVMRSELGFFSSDRLSSSKPKNKIGRSDFESSWKRMDERWKNTIDAQGYYDEYEEPNWQKPLWYALLFIHAIQRRRVNKRGIEETLQKTSRVLLGSYSRTGLLPGLYDEYQQPAVYTDEMNRDDYWHATFEIPYVIWVYGKEYFKTPEDQANKSRKDPPEVIQAMKFMDSGNKAPEVLSHIREAAGIGQQISKSIPFNNLNAIIDQKHIVELSDDWLQQVPADWEFSYQPKFEDDIFLGEAQSQAEKYARLNKVREIDIYLYCDNSSRISTSGRQGSSGQGLVIDIPKNSSGDEIYRKQLQTNKEMVQILAKGRTVQKAKKRLIWIPSGDKATVSLCYLATPNHERGNMQQFMDRHASHEKYFFDGATAELNLWETELHVSFFRLDEYSELNLSDITRKENMTDSSTVRIRMSNKHPAQNDVILSRETISFCLTGDFFDRFWTCHFLENHRHLERDSILSLASRLTAMDLAKHRLNTAQKSIKPWQQRKVLELLLFYEVLDAIHRRTSEILYWVKKRVLHLSEKEESENRNQDTAKQNPKDDPLEAHPFVLATKPLNTLATAVLGGKELLEHGTSENYFSIIEKWRLFEQILLSLEEDLGDNIELLEQWRRREEERKQEKPRWTRNDERKYRTTITKISVLNDRKFREIERLKSNMKRFRESLSSRLESIRNDISFRGSENINLFTYVTVVFLPLGFATGVFSMSGPPDHSTLMSMVGLALVSLALTIYAIANATTGKRVMRPVIHALRSIDPFVFKHLHLIATSIFLIVKPIFLIVKPIYLITTPIFLIITPMTLIVFWVRNQVVFLFVRLFVRYLSIPAERRILSSIESMWERVEMFKDSLKQKLAYQLAMNPAEEARKNYKEREKLGDAETPKTPNNDSGEANKGAQGEDQGQNGA